MTEKYVTRINNKLKQVFRPSVVKRYHQKRKQKYDRVLRNHDPELQTVVIYQMGKVGSSSIKDSLNYLEQKMNLYHVHALAQERIDWLNGIFLHASKIKGKPIVHDHLAESIFLRELIDENKHRDWKIITLIRDPIARNISTFFQSLEIFFPEWEKEHNNEQKKLIDYVDEMIELFLGKADHQMPLIWFDKYMKSIFDIDVYSQEFPKSKGYQIFTSEAPELLLLKLEDINECSEMAFKEYFGINNFELINANISSEKDYSRAYSKFKKSIKLPESYVDEMCSSKIVQHFYKPSEIDEMMVRWKN